MNPETTLIIGATSAMAEQAARLFAADGDMLWLSARDQTRLQELAADLKIRGAAEVRVLPGFDAAEPGGTDALCAEIRNGEGRIDRVLVAHGSLPDQASCAEDAAKAARELEINFVSVVRICTAVAERLESQGEGTLAVISSVAGLRGRQSNYVYGAAKGGLNVFLQGLRNRLHPAGVRVVTLLPGFVDTPMTSDIEKGPLFVSAATAGARIHRALVSGRGEIVYVPFFWRIILGVIRAIPEALFKRLKL